MVLYGYAGKSLDVDLSTGKIVKRDIDPQFARHYIGGMGFGCKILFDEVGPEVEPFSEENIVIFANGPLTGTRAPCSGRTEITTKSPLTGHIGTGNTGGIWGTLLKRAGFDMILIRNKARKPVYLWIDNNVVELKQASHLWGKDTRVTSDIICQESGTSPSETSVLAIGPAGENLVRYACTVNEYYHIAARGGAGAIMGAKQLKAIAVTGSGAIKVARPDEFRAAAREARERLLTSVKKAANARGDVIPSGIESYQARSCFPHKNYQTGVLPDWVKNIGPDTAMKYVTRKEGTCYACPISCFNLVEVKEGKYAGTKIGRGHHPGVVIEWGGKCAISNLPAIWRCKQLCGELGMDEVSSSGVIAFAMELFQWGIITPKDTDGIELTWGNEDATIQMLHKIASRDGFGDVLAEGSVKAAEIIGRGAKKYAMTMKGMELMSADPRSGTRGWIFGNLTNPRGGDNVKGTHFMADKYNPNWWVDEFDMFEDVKEHIYSVSPEVTPSTWEGKALMCKWFEDLYSILNALGLCFFPSGFNLALGPTHISKLFSTCTGWDTAPRDIMKLGERVFNLLKAYPTRQCLDRKDDHLPNRFYTEPLPEGSAKGAVLSRDTIDQLLDEYYGLRGWDRKSGLPTEEKLVELGLDSLVNDLRKLGKLPKK
ncbi:aldehyde ferredoxin oxidoreductase family protein [Chloroflexota bacterium]